MKPARATREGLVRGIRRWDLVALAINAIVGAGIFGLPSEVFGRIGAYSVGAFVVCAFIVALIILCFAEVSSRFSGTGGPYLYAREAFGPLAGFEVGWMILIARLTAFAANCNLLVSYVSFFWPAAGDGTGRAVVILLIVGALTIVNVVGVRSAALTGDVFTVAKLVPLLLLVGVGAFFLEPAAFELGPAPAFGQFSTSVLLLVYAFTGFEMATIPGGETRDPGRDMPYALLMAIGFVAVLYVAIQIVAIGTLPDLATSSRPLADVGSRVLGASGGAIVAGGAIVSIVGNLNVILLTASRLPFAMATRGELPRLLTTTHQRFHTPHYAVMLTAAVVLLLTLTGTFVYAATISVIARLLGYGATCAALPVLRRKSGVPPPAFGAPWGGAAAVAALVFAAWLLAQSTGSQVRDASIAAAVGILIYAWSRKGN
jgi:amino acid transporter